MTQMTAYAPGTPCWVDVSSDDLGRAVPFYESLFGWTSAVASEPEAGGYTMFHLGGRNVGAAGPRQGEAPPAWSTYIATDDADATVAKARDAGGTILSEPFDVFDAGRMAVIQDPTGAVFCIWQAGAHPGAELVNEPGAFCWNELATDDADAAQAFYSAVFGWEPEQMPAGEPGAEFTYRIQKLGESPIAGIMPKQEAMAGAPSHWLAYFAVEDADATVARAPELGGQVIAPPFDMPYGRMAVLVDPTGAAFAIIRLAQP